MKIFIFNDNRELLDEIKEVEEPEPYSLNEIRWNNGGMGGLHHHFVIVEDHINFEDVTDEQILEQQKDAALNELVRDYEKERLRGLKEGTENEKRSNFEAARGRMHNAARLEELIKSKQDFKRGAAQKPTAAKTAAKTAAERAAQNPEIDPTYKPAAQQDAQPAE